MRNARKVCRQLVCSRLTASPSTTRHRQARGMPHGRALQPPQFLELEGARGYVEMCDRLAAGVVALDEWTQPVRQPRARPPTPVTACRLPRRPAVRLNRAARNRLAEPENDVRSGGAGGVVRMSAPPAAALWHHGRTIFLDDGVDTKIAAARRDVRRRPAAQGAVGRADVAALWPAEGTPNSLRRLPPTRTCKPMPTGPASR